MKRKFGVLICAAVIILAVFLIIFIFAKGEEQEVKNLIRTYNDVLYKAHLELNPKLLSRLTSERQLNKVDSYIAYNFKYKRIIKGQLLQLEFREIQIADNSATATTKEKWSWYYIDPATKEPLSDVTEDVYGNTYELIRTEGHWVVDNLISSVLDESGG